MGREVRLLGELSISENSIYHSWEIIKHRNDPGEKEKEKWKKREVAKRNIFIVISGDRNQSISRVVFVDRDKTDDNVWEECMGFRCR